MGTAVQVSPQHVAARIFRNVDDRYSTERGLSEIADKGNVEMISGATENQLLAVVAMNKPASDDSDANHREKLAVLRGGVHANA